jgi:hypothetical protein
MTVRLEKALRELPPEEIETVSAFAEFLAGKHRKGALASPTFSWAGALAGSSEHDTAVELQHKANDWRDSG